METPAATGRHRRPWHEHRVVSVGQELREAGWTGGPQSRGDAFIGSRGYRTRDGGRHRRAGTPAAVRVAEPPIVEAARNLNRAVGQAVVQLNAELTVYLFGGEPGRAAVNAVWDRRERQARTR